MSRPITMPMRATVTSVDNCPPELYDQVPFTADLIRQLPGWDRPDYWLGRLTSPLHHTDRGRTREVRHVILAARLMGTSIGSGPGELTVAIAYVIDEAQVDLPSVDMSKCLYVAIGEAEITVTDQ